MASAEGGFILSGGFGDSDHELARWAVHRFDPEDRPVKSWHPALNHPKWETVRRASGGPVALTKDGGLLVSDAAPFRITRYGDLLGTGPQVAIEDEEVVSASEVDRAATYQTDGYILARTPVETGCSGLSARAGRLLPGHVLGRSRACVGQARSGGQIFDRSQSSASRRMRRRMRLIVDVLLCR